MFGAITKWLAGDNTGKIVDGITSGLDKLVYTEEEKADTRVKILDFKLKWAEITANQSPARRMIALIVTAMWSVLIIVGVVAEALGKSEFAEYCFAVLSDNVNYSFLAIIAFYFAAHVLKSRE